MEQIFVESTKTHKKKFQFGDYVLWFPKNEAIYNNNKKDHHNKRSLHKSKLQRRFEFQTKNSTRKRTQQKMTSKFLGKNVQTSQGDEMKYIFIPTK
jgi:hypothetical protein